MQNPDFKVGIVGAGWIAEKAAITLNGLSGLRAYAIASRSQEKANAFAARWAIAWATRNASCVPTCAAAPC